jgi:hypothetical protein
MSNSERIDEPHEENHRLCAAIRGAAEAEVPS